MAQRPQDYVSHRGRTTTNTVEGFHGLALLYRSKRTDLGHTHYVCKTNMAICHKVCSHTQHCTRAYPLHITIRTWGPSGKYCVSCTLVLRHHNQPFFPSSRSKWNGTRSVVAHPQRSISTRGKDILSFANSEYYIFCKETCRRKQGRSGRNLKKSL